MLRPLMEPCSRGVIGAQPCPRELGREISPQRRRMVLAGCVLASSMAFIDGTALTVALPNLRAAVDADLTSVQWVLNGYALALASLTLIGGAFADAYGRARMLSTGSLLFGAASSRVAQLAGVAIAAGVGSFASGYQDGLLAAAALTVTGALTVRSTAPPESVRLRASL
jgi:MFS family permease